MGTPHMNTNRGSQTHLDIRRSHQRFHAQISWLDSHHSLSFSDHYAPDNTHHGLLLVSNDDVVKPNTGFRAHPHHDMEIVTWVLDGELEHKDSEGNTGILYPGLAQRMSAGTPRSRPDTRKKVELGTLTITNAVADSQTAEKKLLFMPATLVPGIEAADPMIAARSAAYIVSLSRGAQTQ
jgi:hypothetical protein